MIALDAFTPSRHAGPMTDDEVIAKAGSDGLEREGNAGAGDAWGVRPGATATIGAVRVTSKNARRSTGGETASAVLASSRQRASGAGPALPRNREFQGQRISRRVRRTRPASRCS